jgi:hypothetical protein
VQPDKAPAKAKRAPKPATDRVISVRAIVWGAVLVVLVAAASVFLLLRYFSTAEAAPRLEAIRVASTIVLGTGGGVALYLAARRQRSAELTLQENTRIAAETAADRAKDLAQRERAAQDTRDDARYSRRRAPPRRGRTPGRPTAARWAAAPRLACALRAAGLKVPNRGTGWVTTVLVDLQGECGSGDGRPDNRPRLPRASRCV